jgi:LemA protein
LQEELTGTEGRIAFSRQFYNEQVLAYDNALETFPTNTIAGAFNFEPKPYFEAEEETRQNVAVNFGDAAPGAAGGPVTPAPATPAPTGGTAATTTPPEPGTTPPAT